MERREWVRSAPLATKTRDSSLATKPSNGLSQPVKPRHGFHAANRLA